MQLYDKKRRHWQVLFLFIHLLIYLYLIIGVSGVAHSYCPQAIVCFGCLNLGQQIGNWMFPAAIISGIILFLSVLFIGRQYCGLVCPFGIAQELIFSLNKKAAKRKYKNLIPLKFHKIMKYFKYFVLAGMIAASLTALSYRYMKACPVMSLAHIQHIALPGIISLLFIFAAGFFVERFWCNYLCPFGALLNIGQYLGKFLKIPRRKINWNRDSCLSCNLCNAFCPMRIDVMKSAIVEDVECIYCHRCQLTCPEYKKRKKNEV